MEFVQVSCAPFPFQTLQSCEVLTPKVTSDNPKLPRARLKRLDDSAVGREATAIRCVKRRRVQDC